MWTVSGGRNANVHECHGYRSHPRCSGKDRPYHTFVVWLLKAKLFSITEMECDLLEQFQSSEFFFFAVKYTRYLTRSNYEIPSCCFLWYACDCPIIKSFDQTIKSVTEKKIFTINLSVQGLWSKQDKSHKWWRTHRCLGVIYTWLTVRGQGLDHVGSSLPGKREWSLEVENCPVRKVRNLV